MIKLHGVSVIMVMNYNDNFRAVDMICSDFKLECRVAFVMSGFNLCYD